MYLDLIVVLIVIIFGLIKYKRFSSYVYLFCFTDILFRVLTFINTNLHLGGIESFVNTYIPESIYSVIVKYTSDIVETCLVWGYVALFVIFLYYTLQILLKKR